MSKLNKGTIISDRFMLIECLGTGLFSQVWRAIDETLDTEVALKVYTPLTPDGMKELKREYSNTIGVSHQNLLTPQGMDVCSDGAYLVMKCCSKGSASALAGMVDELAVWHFVHDVAAGLAHLHGLEEPIIHQDMKLANIMIDDDDCFLISDFGICYKVTQIMVRQTGRGRSAAMAYMSPERFSADYDVPLTSSDIWTLGALIYELCTGVTPFGDFGGAAQRNGQVLPKLPRGWSKELNMLYNACMQINTWDRPKATKIRDFASLMLKQQKPSPELLGIATYPPVQSSDYTKNTPESLLSQLGVNSDPQPSSPAAVSSDGNQTGDNSMPAYMSLGNDGAPAYVRAGSGTEAPDGYEHIDTKDKSAHFTSGTRYRGRAERRTTRHVNKHRTPMRKAYDWLKSKSSYLSFILIVALCGGVYWYGLDNLLSLKFLPEKKSNGNAVVETVLPVDNLDAVAVLNSDNDSVEETIDPSNVRFVNNLPTPPPPREHKGITGIGTTSDKPAVSPNGDTRQENIANAPQSAPQTSPQASTDTKQGNKDTKSEEKKKPETGAKSKSPTPQQQGGELNAAMQKGDYAAVKRLADGGSAAAAGVMARKYLNDNNYGAADEYAQKAKKGGDPAGEEVIGILVLQGYYQ